MSIQRIEAYSDFLKPAFLQSMLDANLYESSPILGLEIYRHLQTQYPKIETPQALAFMVEIYEGIADHLNEILAQRKKDRAFLDQLTLDLKKKNEGIDYLAKEYATVLNHQDAQNRKLVGFHDQPIKEIKAVQIPQAFQGEQITLFGPPDSAKMTINAMNAFHRKLANEPQIVTELVNQSGQIPRWGADSEDSKTPMMANLLAANENLRACFEKRLSLEENGKRYELASSHLAKAIKRIPGLALPDGHHLYHGQPLPLHLVDFALHFYHHAHQPEALVFYIPKLENEEEAKYLHGLLNLAETLIQKRFPNYQIGTIKLMIVFENPRAIFRIKEIAHNLYPYFMGGSLGWHDYLASTARLFKNDPNYRIPVKADPNIVIHHIKESHVLLAKSLGAIQAIKLGGMYGILYEDGNEASFEVSMVGYIKDVITQLKRGLDGFWVAHPAFVRIGIALTYAFRLMQAGDQTKLKDLICALVVDQTEQEAILHFVFSPDVEGLDPNDPLYLRGILAADLDESSFIKNSDDDEVRYNLFQALQYLADWLSGNGCVALPALMKNQKGEKIFVRVMDDLATTERSRWEVWAEIHHGRVSKDKFEQILAQEIQCISQNLETPLRKIQVKWTEQNQKWYQVAIQILRQLVLSDEPVEFATELLLPFTFDWIRQADQPWEVARLSCDQLRDL